MKHLSKGSRLIVFVILLSVLTGCAVFSGGKVPETRLVEPTAEEQTKPTLNYEFIGGSDKMEQEFLEELNKSQYFKKITGESTGADIELNVRLTYIPNLNLGGDSILPMISFLSLFRIPVWGTDHYILEVRVKNKIGLEKEYKLENSVTFALWLPLIVFTPFTWNTDENVRKNMYRNFIHQMYEDGFMGEI